MQRKSFFQIRNEIPNHGNFGLLVEKWANGTEKQKPVDYQKFKKLLKDNNILFDEPDGNNFPIPTQVNYIELKEGVVNVLMPTEKMLAEGKKDTDAARDGYPFPEEIHEAFGCPPKSDLTDDEKEVIFWGSIGDYCSSQCF